MIDSVRSGDPTLDYILGGGIPRNRSVLVTGGPGTGKSTLSMQFLQEGLRQDEDCLFVSTEQTPVELRDTFAPYDFDLDHEKLTITSIHARPGYTLESDEEQLTIETLEGDQLVGEGYSAPFSSKYVSQLLGRYAPADRVVIDSVSGLQAMSDDYDVFRRAVLDLIRQFSDEFEATALLVAEETDADADGNASGVNALQYNTHGVVRLWTEGVRNDPHRFLRVEKMRGRRHDTRVYEMDFVDNRGVYVAPRNRGVDRQLTSDSFINTQIPGLDELCGGGLAKGESIVFKHDGRTHFRPLFIGMLKQYLEAKGALLLIVPDVGGNPERLEQLFPEDPDRIWELLETDQLFVIDLGSQQNSTHRNIFPVTEQRSGVEHLLERIDDRRDDSNPLSSLVKTEAAVRLFGVEETLELHRWQAANLLGSDNVVMYLHNPATIPDDVDEFLTNKAAQALDLWRHDNGLQYLTLEKSPAGYVSTTRLIDSIDDPPFVRIQAPPNPETTMFSGETS